MFQSLDDSQNTRDPLKNRFLSSHLTSKSGIGPASLLFKSSLGDSDNWPFGETTCFGPVSEYVSSPRHYALFENLGSQFQRGGDQGWNEIWPTQGMGVIMGNRAQDAVEGGLKSLIHTV